MAKNEKILTALSAAKVCIEIAIKAAKKDNMDKALIATDNAKSCLNDINTK